MDRTGPAQRATTQPINNSTLCYTHCNITPIHRQGPN